MKAWVVCTALLLISSNAIAQSQGNPPPNGQGQGDDRPPPGYQDQQGDRPPPGYQDQQGDAPPPGYQDQQGNGPPPGYQDQQGDEPPPGYQGEPANGPPPGYDDQQGYDPQDQDDRQDNLPPDANPPYAQPNARTANPGQGGEADRGTIDRMGGWVLVTSDANWQSKWETPSNTRPTFAVARDVARGKKVFALIFFANPQLDRAGQANVTCDIEMTRPDGSVSTRQSDAVCFAGALQGDPHDTYLSTPVIGFTGEPGDPAGTWRIKVTLKDNNRHVSVPIQAAFNLKK